MKDIQLVLEFTAIKTRLLAHAHTVIATKAMETLSFIDKKKLASELSMLTEMMSFTQRYSRFPIQSSQLLAPYFDKGRKGAAFTPIEINDVAEDLRTIERVITLFRGKQASFPLIAKAIGSLATLDDLLEKITRVLAPDLSIKDSASPALNKIRHQKRALEQKISHQINKLTETYSSYLSDRQPVVRNGHLVLPVLSQEKGKVEGIIHAISDTGYTTFIEPSALVNLNNEMYVLEQSELEEIHRILLALTQAILVHEGPIVLGNETLGYLDLVGAKAAYGLEINGHVAEISLARTIELELARHPLIDPRKVVPNTFKLDDKNRIVIITGPNAGGKTVAMKTVGLLVYMHQCGLALPTSKPGRLSYFDHIYADIGDSQSLMDNLSTFAGHISNLAMMVKQVDPTDLVLIDELGTGTDPSEGEALAVALLRYLAKKGPFVIVSSHFALLKQLGYSEAGMRNASMRFNEKKLTPTYELVLDIPGRSYGLEMARRYGLDDEIIAAADQIIASSRQDASKLIDDLQIELEEQREKTASLFEKEKLLENRLLKAGEEAQRIEQEKRNLQAEMKLERTRILKQAQEEAKQAIAALSNPNLKLHEAIAVKRMLEHQDLEEELVISSDQGELAVGDYAAYEAVGVSGKITSISKKQTTLLTTDGKTIKVMTANLVKIEPPIEKEKKVAFINKNEIRVSPELNIIGQRVDEALDSLDAYLDSALAANLKRVRIIHGLGTGALRRMVTNYLDSKSFVASYRYGEAGEGGAGATVVFLK